MLYMVPTNVDLSLKRFFCEIIDLMSLKLFFYSETKTLTFQIVFCVIFCIKITVASYIKSELMYCWMSQDPKIQSSKAIKLHSDFFVMNPNL